MACLRCRISPIITDAQGQVTAITTGGVDQRWLELDESNDVELVHARRGASAFAVVTQPPPGHGHPRLCSLCSGVYYPRKKP